MFHVWPPRVWVGVSPFFCSVRAPPRAAKKKIEDPQFRNHPACMRARPPKNSEEAIFAATPNRWPQIPRNFRKSFEIYYQEMNSLSNKLMYLFAMALNLPKDFFLPYIGDPISALRANHYPAISFPHLKGQLRAGEHSDYGTLTILMQDSSDEGLEICNRDGIWIPVAIKAPKLIINIGDLMQRWTNNRWISSLHRVVVPSDNPSQEKYRISIAYFHQPNWDAVIRCIPSCLNHNEKPFYLPIRSGAYLMRKFRSTTLWIDAEPRFRCIEKTAWMQLSFSSWQGFSCYPPIPKSLQHPSGHRRADYKTYPRKNILWWRSSLQDRKCPATPYRYPPNPINWSQDVSFSGQIHFQRTFLKSSYQWPIIIPNCSVNSGLLS